MNKRARYLIGIIAVIPLTLTAEAILTGQDATSGGNLREAGEFRAVELVPTQSAGFANRFYTVPVQPY